MTRNNVFSYLSYFGKEQFFERDYMSFQVWHLETKFELNVGLKYAFVKLKKNRKSVILIYESLTQLNEFDN